MSTTVTTTLLADINAKHLIMPWEMYTLGLPTYKQQQQPSKATKCRCVAQHTQCLPSSIVKAALAPTLTLLQLCCNSAATLLQPCCICADACSVPRRTRVGARMKPGGERNNVAEEVAVGKTQAQGVGGAIAETCTHGGNSGSSTRPFADSRCWTCA